MPKALYSPLLEVCVDDPQGLSAAVSGGADRIELCSALALGGLTPSPGLIAAAAELAVPVFAMIRPRPGGFVYSHEELAVAKADIAAVRNAGLAGIVLGVTHPDGRLDRDAIAGLRDAAGDLPMVLHRAFDLSPDLLEGLETAIELGFCRILTSGGAPSAIEGAENIARLAGQARGRITILAGGGVDAGNAARLLRAGADELHGSCSEICADQDMGGRLRIASERAQTSVAKIRALRAAMEQTGEEVT